VSWAASHNSPGQHSQRRGPAEHQWSGRFVRGGPALAVRPHDLCPGRQSAAAGL